jgi:hypothetical protein
MTVIKQGGHFDEAHIIHELKHLLPSQQALKDFIHHNSLHAFQHMKFYDAIFKASKIFGFQVHLQLSEFREMNKTGRIRNDILEMTFITLILTTGCIHYYFGSFVSF